MILDLRNFSASDYAAWWEGGIATLALTWNIIHMLRAGQRAEIEVASNIRVYPMQPPTNDNNYVSIKAVNRGTGPTTITHCAVFYTKNIWGLIKKSEGQCFVINVAPQMGTNIPLFWSLAQN